MVTSIQDRTDEFRAILSIEEKKRKRQTIGADRTRNGFSAGDSNSNKRTGQRSQFAQSAADIGHGITETTEKLRRLALLAKRRSLFDDKPVEIAELTYVIKQDLSALNTKISALQALSKTKTQSGLTQQIDHNKSVIVSLQGKLVDVGVNFKGVLEERTKNIQESRARTDNFMSSVSASSQSSIDPYQSASPLYNTPTKSPTPSPGYANSDVLNLEPSSAMSLPGQNPERQALMMEEAQAPNTYISERSNAIEAIERTINELGGIFGQLATMVQEQGEQISRIDADTEDVVDNVQGAQRELMKYWSRVSGNRWLVAKMFGVLMIFFLLWVLIAG